MNLSQQDREWVGAIVKQAATETLNTSRDFTRVMVEKHANNCPNLKRWKWMALGLGVGLGVSAPQMAQAVMKLIGT